MVVCGRNLQNPGPTTDNAFVRASYNYNSINRIKNNRLVRYGHGFPVSLHVRKLAAQLVRSPGAMWKFPSHTSIVACSTVTPNALADPVELCGVNTRASRQLGCRHLFLDQHTSLVTFDKCAGWQAEIHPLCSVTSQLLHRNGLNLLIEVTQRQTDRWRQADEQTWPRGPSEHVFPLQPVLFGLLRSFPTFQMTFDSM